MPLIQHGLVTQCKRTLRINFALFWWLNCKCTCDTSFLFNNNNSNNNNNNTADFNGWFNISRCTSMSSLLLPLSLLPQFFGPSNSMRQEKETWLRAILRRGYNMKELVKRIAACRLCFELLVRMRLKSLLFEPETNGELLLLLLLCWHDAKFGWTAMRWRIVKSSHDAKIASKSDASFSHVSRAANIIYYSTFVT